MIKGVIFDIDDTLFDSTSFSETARKAALKSMINSGLRISYDQGLKKLRGIIRTYGSNYTNHFNIFLRELDRYDPKLIATAVKTYHDIKYALLKPFSDTVPTLLELKKMNYRMGVVSDGFAVKQWDKLIRLGLQYFFDKVTVSEETGKGKPHSSIFLETCKGLDLNPQECMYVGNDLYKDIRGANTAGLVSVRIKKGKNPDSKPKNKKEKPDHEIKNLNEVLEILKE